MEHQRQLEGIVTEIKDDYRVNNYSFVLERLVTVRSQEEEIIFLISRFTKMKQGSFFMTGDRLLVVYEEDSLYPCFDKKLYEALEVMVL